MLKQDYSLGSADAIHRIVLVGGEAMSRQMMPIIDAAADLVCEGTFDRPSLAEAHIAKLHPHLAVLDDKSPGMSGIAMAAVLRQRMPGLKILLLTEVRNSGCFHSALEAGVNGLLVKPFHRRECLSVLRSVLHGCRIVSASASAHWDGVFFKPAATTPLNIRITARERRLLGMLAQGKMYKELAASFQVSGPAMHKWMHKLYAKLGVHSGKEAVACWCGCGCSSNNGFAARAARNPAA